MGLVAAIGTAVTAVAASVGVGIAATALTVGFTTIAAVGAVVGVVGQVTHNKVLSMVGLGLGAVGGIGALAAGAGLLGSGAGLLGEAPTTAAAADAASAGTIDSVAASSGLGNASAAEEMLGLPAAGSAEAGGAAADAASGLSLGDVTKGLDVAKQILPADSSAPPDIGHATGSAGGANTSADALNAAELTKIQNAGGSLLNATPPAASVTGAASITPLVPPPAAPGTGVVPDMNAAAFKSSTDALGMKPTDEGGGTFDGILKFANKNPVVALGALQAAGSMLSGFSNTVTPAQVNALNSQAAANDAATALVKQQTANLNMPKATAQSAPVTGAPQQLVPTLRPLTAPQTTPAGFINQAPVPTQPITGVAA